MANFINIPLLAVICIALISVQQTEANGSPSSLDPRDTKAVDVQNVVVRTRRQQPPAFPNMPPVFLRPSYVFIVPSDFPVGGKVGQVYAIDYDSSVVLFYSFHPVTKYFSINSATGDIFTRESLIPGLLSATTEVSDYGVPRLSATADVFIYVEVKSEPADNQIQQ